MKKRVEGNEQSGSKKSNQIPAGNCSARALMCLHLARGSLIVNHDTNTISIDAIRLLIEDAIASLQRYG